MKKLVLKVIGITLLALIAAACFIYAALLIFAPQTLARFYDSVGNYDRAATFMYKRYEISGDKADLVQTCKFAIKSGKTDKEEKYLVYLVDDEGFFGYCGADEDLGAGFYDFICEKYVVAAYLNGKNGGVIAEKANALTKSYTDSCALRALAFACVEKNDKETLSSVKAYMDKIAETDGQNNVLDYDIARIDGYLGGAEG